jgi:uroporphyrin-III C-methyltransferase
VIVGAGILTPAHLTQETIGKISSADIVYTLVPDPLGLSTIKKLNSKIADLADYYFDPKSEDNGKNRLEAYDVMVDVVLSSVRKNLKVVCVFYGHPGIFVYPAHKMIAEARADYFMATMLPAISAEDCLYSDLGIDPGYSGCVSFEASQYLFFNHPSNPYATMILWQIGVVGDEYLNRLVPAEHGLEMLRERLLQNYPPEHRVILYEASTLPIMQHRCEEITISELPSAKVSTITTLVIPPAKTLAINHEFCSQWKVAIDQLT